MSTSAYDPNNIFAKILRGELPSTKIFEDEHVVTLFMQRFKTATDMWRALRGKQLQQNTPRLDRERMCNSRPPAVRCSAGHPQVHVRV